MPTTPTPLATSATLHSRSLSASVDRLLKEIIETGCNITNIEQSCKHPEHLIITVSPKINSTRLGVMSFKYYNTKSISNFTLTNSAALSHWNDLVGEWDRDLTGGGSKMPFGWKVKRFHHRNEIIITYTLLLFSLLGFLFTNRDALLKMIKSL